MSKLDWKGLLDHLIIVEGECMEENYGKGCGANDSDEECNAGIRKAYAQLVKVQPVLMAAPELLTGLQAAVESLVELAQYEEAAKDMVATGWFDNAVKAIAKAKGVPNERP